MKRLTFIGVIAALALVAGCSTSAEPAATPPANPSGSAAATPTGQSPAPGAGMDTETATAIKNDKELSINPNGPLAKQGAK